MLGGDEAREVFAKIQAGREWDRVCPTHPVCPGCDRRERPDLLRHRRLDGELVCAECIDDQTQLLTGCRFGLPDCDHPDCA